MSDLHVLAADIGGGHVSAAVVNLTTGALLPDTRSHAPVDSKGRREDILDAWAKCLNTALKKGDVDTLKGVAFAMPGPFNYRNGIAHFGSSDKYESLRDANIPAVLAPRLEYTVEMRFINDATAFGIGEARKLADTNVSAVRVLAVTLGTGFGSAFLENGIPVTGGPSVPLHGSLWHLPFQDGISDDFVSVRWLRSQFANIRDEPFRGVREIAEIARTDDRCAAIFEEYGANLGIVVAEWVARFDAESLIIGGNIVGAFDLFGKPLIAALAAADTEVPIVIAENTDESAITGAARLFEDEYWEIIKNELPTT